MKRIALIFALALPIYAQTAKPKTAPVISIEMREKFFKAQSEYQAISSQLREVTQSAQEKNSTLQNEIKKIQAVCGTDFQPNLDKDGELVCVEKTPEPAKK